MPAMFISDVPHNKYNQQKERASSSYGNTYKTSTGVYQYSGYNQNYGKIFSTKLARYSSMIGFQNVNFKFGHKNLTTKIRAHFASTYLTVGGVTESNAMPKGTINTPVIIKTMNIRACHQIVHGVNFSAELYLDIESVPSGALPLMLQDDELPSHASLIPLTKELINWDLLAMLQRKRPTTTSCVPKLNKYLELLNAINPTDTKYMNTWHVSTMLENRAQVGAGAQNQSKINPTDTKYMNTWHVSTMLENRAQVGAGAQNQSKLLRYIIPRARPAQWVYGKEYLLDTDRYSTW
ncbi:hypothetical protein T265_03436 [Opisthorchis viverrini]|uniref:Uncharacterized protein n=1 Tax=Opisthorchis viverrini TaxID=6198 RepID=A0A075A3B8_OPIVI|nr:hypothetical protein T265_03436 [Opisthorchis viverrini]KER30065.1 hypothetical protein T265_03436 [Opisthorchis viverrini]